VAAGLYGERPYFTGGIQMPLYLNKATGVKWVVDDKNVIERLESDSNYELVKEPAKDTANVDKQVKKPDIK
jgi:hypothetical protein